MNFQKQLLIFQALLLSTCFSNRAFAQADTAAFRTYRDGLRQQRVWLDTTLRIEPVRKGGYLSPTVDSIGTIFSRVFRHYSKTQHWAACGCAPTYELDYKDSVNKAAQVLSGGQGSPLFFNEFDYMLRSWHGCIHLTFYEDGRLAMSLRDNNMSMTRYYTLNRFGSVGRGLTGSLGLLSQRFMPAGYDTLARKAEALKTKIRMMPRGRVDSLAVYRLLYVSYTHHGWTAFANPRGSQRCFIVQGEEGDTLRGYELPYFEGIGYFRMLLASGSLTRDLIASQHDSIPQIEAMKKLTAGSMYTPGSFAFDQPNAYGDRYLVITGSYSEHDATDDIDDEVVYYYEKVKR